MDVFPPLDLLRPLIDLARREDLGPAGDDVTSRLTIPDSAVGVATLVQKQTGIVCGLPLVEPICRAYDERLRVELIPGFHLEIIEGRFSDAQSTPLLRIRGPLRSLLSAERVVLNFLQRMSGVATLTQRFVRRVIGTEARIYDTRKTIPGFRALDKYAVRAGGGYNHRIGLYDGLLIKDNHVAAIPARQLVARLQPMIDACREESPDRLVEVEVDTLEQLREVLKLDGVDVILLDNMDCPKMEQAVELRNKAQSLVDLEASGGVTLETVRSIAQTGVERIAVGAITHSAPALDIGLDVED
jgi:nicotinate-nucleotide pyrophosphorylase (carboxylating)